jgi:hypothetical protein
MILSLRTPRDVKLCQTSQLRVVYTPLHASPQGVALARVVAFLVL